MITSSNIMFVFLFFSVIGWVLENIIASIASKKITRPGFFFGPYRIGHGAAATIALVISENTGLGSLGLLLLCIGLMLILAFLAEVVFRKILDADLKDSILRRLLGICIYACTGFLIISFCKPFMSGVVASLSPETVRVISNAFLTILGADVFLSLYGLANLVRELDTVEKELAQGGQPDVSFVVRHPVKYKLHLIKSYGKTGFEGYVAAESYIERAMDAYHRPSPFSGIARKFSDSTSSSVKEAAGDIRKYLNFHHLFWVFMIAGILGYVIETIYCVVTRGVLESRQGLLYGPFSQVYGLAAVFMLLTLLPLKYKNDRWLFFGGAIIGGVFEIICSLIQEALFGSVSWDYGARSLGIAGGRTSLVYMLFWGILGTFFIKDIHPRFEKIIDRIPKKQGLTLTSVTVVLMCINITLSATAVYRWGERTYGQPPSNKYEEFLDWKYPDDYMVQVYPNMNMLP